MKATTVCITSTKAENYFLYIRSRQGFHPEIFVRKAFKIDVWNLRSFSYWALQFSLLSFCEVLFIFILFCHTLMW